MAEEKNGKNEKRAIYLMGDVDEKQSSDFIKSIFKLEMEEPLSDIVVIIDSYGGSVDSLWAMVDAMNLVHCNIHTLCTGKAMSAGQVILTAGSKGCRYATPNSRIMMHQIRTIQYGTVTGIQVQTDELKRLDKQFKNFIIKNTKIKKEQLDKLLQEDFYMNPERALELGIIDKIINKFSDIRLKGW